MFSALLKTYYCEKRGINPENLYVVSVIPQLVNIGVLPPFLSLSKSSFASSIMVRSAVISILKHFTSVL